MSASLCVDKLKDLVLRFVWVLVLVETQVLIYDTENRENIDKFDCVYHTTLDGDEIPYCQRSRNTLTLDRSRMTCDNDAEKICFRDLIDQYVHPNNVLRWSSSIDMADLYARIYYTRSLLIHYREEFICNCTAKGTFGRYCEYRLTHNSGLFSGSVENQFLQKRLGDSWNTQRYGKILCYETLPCNTGDFCLDWREIGDGFQRCSSGIDEENWDKLEFNECEDDEFRCLNGMCIAEEFWLDGQFLQVR